jgi:anaerobic magnesium-protoporphyrin IX monomethyl ester cyclase
VSKKILFITPPYHCGVVEVAGRWVPLTFVYLAGAVRQAGFEPLIYDAMTKRVGFKEIASKIAEVKPDYVATSAITSTTPDALKILKTAKEINNNIVTILGGVHPSFMYKEALANDYVDYVVRGEGEETLKELLTALETKTDLEAVKGIAYRQGSKVVTTPPRPLIQDLDSLPTAWDLIEWQDYHYFVVPKSRLGSVSTSRGCSHACTFCSQQKFWHRSWRPRTPEAVVDEIEMLLKRYGVNVVLFPDEHPTYDRQRWEKLLDLLIEKDLGVYILMETRAEDIVRDQDILAKYRQAGIIHIYIGVEATNQETLDVIKKEVDVETGIKALKLIHQHGMISETSFILGFPNETPTSIKTTLELANYYNPDFAHFLTLAPWPYADIYEEMQPHIAEKDYRKYNLIDPVIKPEKMSLAEVDKAIIDCYHSFYMRKLKELVALPDSFKKRYILHSMKLIMRSSFIVDKLGGFKTIPLHVKTLMTELDKEKTVTEKTDGQAPAYISLAKDSIFINQSPEEVFQVVAKPQNWPKFVKGLSKVTGDSLATLKAGAKYNWQYQFLGFNVSGSGTVTEYIKNKKLVLKVHNLTPVVEVITLERANKGTLLTLEIGYDGKSKLVSFLFSLMLKTMNLRETHETLVRIKTLCQTAGKKTTEALPSSSDIVV